MQVSSRQRQFDALARAHSGDLYRYAYWLCGDAALAQDLTQEAFLRAWRSLDSLRETVPAAFSRAAAQVEEITRRGLDRAKEASMGVRDQVYKAGDRTVGYIKDEPVKSVLIAAATGAAVALLVGWAMRSRSHREH